MRGCGITMLLWFAGGVFITAFTTAKGQPWEALLSIIMILMLTVAPVVGVMYGFKIIGYLNWRQKKGYSNIAWRVVIGFWFLLCGAAILLIAADNAYRAATGMVESPGMKKVIAGLVILLTCAGVRQLGLFIMRQAFSKESISTEERDIADAETTRRSWENLDFASLESQLGCILPAAYKEMMQPGSEWREKNWMLHPRGLDNHEEYYDVLSLHPPDPSALRRHPITGETLLCFARAEYDEYLLKPGTEDPPVLFRFEGAEPDTIEEIAPHLSVFLAWPKKEWGKAVARMD
jgi:hypothetical protein